MITLSAALQAVHGGAIQKPAWLVEIGFSTPARLSSYGDLTYDSKSWTAADVDVSRVKVDATKVAGEIVLGNADDSFSALILGEGVADKTIKIYGYDAGATATADIVLLVQCAGGEARIGPARATIRLRDSAEYTASPRSFVNAASGFTYILPAGASLTINGQTYKVERR